MYMLFLLNFFFYFVISTDITNKSKCPSPKVNVPEINNDFKKDCKTNNVNKKVDKVKKDEDCKNKKEIKKEEPCKSKNEDKKNTVCKSKNKNKKAKDCKKKKEKCSRELWDCSDFTNDSVYSQKYVCDDKEDKDGRIKIKNFNYDLCKKNQCENDDDSCCKCDCFVDSHDPTKTKDEI